MNLLASITPWRLLFDENHGIARCQKVCDGHWKRITTRPVRRIGLLHKSKVHTLFHGHTAKCRIHTKPTPKPDGIFLRAVGLNAGSRPLTVADHRSLVAY